MAPDRIVWVDTETTGLDPHKHDLLEIACIVTESDLSPVNEGGTLVIRPARWHPSLLDPFIVDMHTKSGLLDRVNDGLPVEAAENILLEYLERSEVEPGSSPLAGNSIAFDRGFIQEQMPKFNKHLHYRHIDVSTVKELVRRWNPGAFVTAPPKTGNHRALGDIQDSLAELRHYRAAGLTPSSE